MKKINKICIFMLFCMPCTLFLSCTGYDVTYRSYSEAVAAANIAQAEAAKAYYQLKAVEIQQETALKVAAINRAVGNSGGVIFIGNTGNDEIKPAFSVSMPTAPDSAPGAKYAVEAMKTVAYGATAVLLGHEIFDTIENISGSVSNVNNSSTNHEEANQANSTVNVADSGNTANIADSGNSTSTETNETSTTTSTVSNSYNPDSSDNSSTETTTDNSDNSVVRPEVVQPVVVVEPAIVQPVVVTGDNSGTDAGTVTP